MVAATPIARPWQRRSLQRAGVWAAVLGLPLAATLFIWWGIVRPQRERWMAWQDRQAFIELRPELNTLVQESRDALAAWRRASFVTDDPSAITQTVERLADHEGVTLQHVTVEHSGVASSRTGRRRPQRTAPSSVSAEMRSVDVEAVGSFGRLARWLEAVETQAGLQVDEWVMAPVSDDAGGQQRLLVTLTAQLGGV